MLSGRATSRPLAGCDETLRGSADAVWHRRGTGSQPAAYARIAIARDAREGERRPKLLGDEGLVVAATPHAAKAGPWLTLPASAAQRLHRSRRLAILHSPSKMYRQFSECPHAISLGCAGGFR